MKGKEACFQASWQETRFKEDTDPGMGYPRVIIAGGGTGGHLFPGIAVAREFERRRGDAEILFVVGRRPMESDILGRHGYQTASIDVEGLKGRGWRKGLVVMLALPKSFIQSVSIIRRFSPRLVLGMGGYSAGPCCLAGRCLGLPTAVHEQNTFPGLTNRLLAPFVDRVLVSFEESVGHLRSGSVVHVGNPVRAELLTGRCREVTGADAFHLLVLGGSQGASALNRAVADALSHLKRHGRFLRVTHQTGHGDYPTVVQDYQDRGLEGNLVPFIEDMAEAYHRADLVISRAGATTVAELAVMGKPSVLVPYPHATNRHQDTNALSLSDAGGAVLMRQGDLSGEALAGLVLTFLEDRAALERMGAEARKKGTPEAARLIVDELEEIMGL
jgi:UDP-N-acetylglucosamine--N-acetylmuramyl-(pentapeptide) pyrophosphoryl-undecaprenol N-acetylglucosamine transferase